ncbi:MAG TPA: ATP-binding cassette domain-containing protein [Flavobacteriales bacterium]|nr:ATP-binding cassette domain-containing protein [Flavobacteriales bacterium]HIN39510.1 ATP-binding cassette domain-containing protein [Flavobacteriales bacterium]
MNPIISLSNASIFQTDHLVLSDVSLSINNGEFVYLIGKTGTGKSSLLKTLYSDLPLKEGEGSIVDFNLKQIKTRQIPLLRRKLGIVFQDFQLLTDRNVEENLMFVMRATGWKDKTKMKEKIQIVLDKVALSTKGFKMPYELSGGEQQRVVIARALINDPDVILADEPTGNLDPEISEEIIKLLIEISKTGKAVLVATHDYNILNKFPSRTIRFGLGKVVDETPAGSLS